MVVHQSCNDIVHTVMRIFRKVHAQKNFTFLAMLTPFPKVFRQVGTFIGSQSSVRSFGSILPSGEKVERELSPVEREFINVKDAEFSKLGLYRKETTNEATLYKLFQLAQSGNKFDYAACVFAINHFYNFGVELNHYDFTNRWIAVAVETGRLDEAVAIVKLWPTWLSCPPRIELVDVLIGMVKPDQSRELLASIRENWQMPLSSRSYATVIRNALSEVNDAYRIWEDAVSMDVILPMSIQRELSLKLSESGRQEEADKVESVMQKQSIGGIVIV